MGPENTDPQSQLWYWLSIPPQREGCRNATRYVHFYKNPWEIWPDTYYLTISFQTASRAPHYVTGILNTCDDKGECFPRDLGFDDCDGFQESAWLILGREKKIKTIVWTIHTPTGLGGTSQFSEKQTKKCSQTTNLSFTHTDTQAHAHTHFLIQHWALSYGLGSKCHISFLCCRIAVYVRQRRKPYPALGNKSLLPQWTSRSRQQTKGEQAHLTAGPKRNWKITVPICCSCPDSPQGNASLTQNVSVMLKLPWYLSSFNSVSAFIFFEVSITTGTKIESSVLPTLLDLGEPTVTQGRQVTCSHKAYSLTEVTDNKHPLKQKKKNTRELMCSGEN